MGLMTIVKFLTAGALFIAIADLPLGYYMPLRILVFVSAIACTIDEWKDDFNFWIITLLILGIMFNPLFPIYLYNKDPWIYIDALSGLFFASMGIKDLLKNRKVKNRVKEAD